MANEDRATRYHRLRRRGSLMETGAAAVTLLLLLLSGTSAALRVAIAARVGDAFLPVVSILAIVLVVLIELAQVPFAFYRGVTLERRYGLSTQPVSRWWVDQVKSVGIGLVFAVGAAVLVCSLIRWSPDRWWIAASVCFALILTILAQLTPVLFLPLFFDVKALDRPALARRLVTLAERAGARAIGVFEWRLGDRTRKANAVLAGIGGTRRILISDTLLAEHSDDEIEVILAHELAHHVHRDIWSSIACQVVLLAAGFYVADRLLTALATSFGLTGKADPAALPLILLAAGGISIVLLPVANALSRAHERRADEFALKLTGNAPAFVTAMKRLTAQNLAEEQPSWIVERLFHSHPSMRTRIEAAERWSRRVEKVEEVEKVKLGS